jgi:hypothetical protein
MKPKPHYCVHESPLLDTYLEQPESIPTLTQHIIASYHLSIVVSSHQAVRLNVCMRVSISLNEHPITL